MDTRLMEAHRLHSCCRRVLRALALALILGQLGAGSALAYSKAKDLSCQQMRSMIHKQGKVYFFTRFGKTEKFVNNAGFCFPDGKKIGYFSVIDNSGKFCSLRYCTDSDLDNSDY